MKHVLLTLTALWILVGCQATAPKQQQKTAADDPSRPCFEAIGYSTQLRPLEEKIGGLNSINGLTLEHLTRTDTATAADKPILSLWSSERNRCVAAGDAFRRQYQPAMYAGIIESQNEEFTILLSKLYSGSITYGQFNTARKELAAKTAERYRQAQISEKQSQAAQQQAIAAERARSAAEFNNAMMMLQAARPRPMPQQNFSTHCESRNVSGTIYTNCR